jgi:HK97 family phage portal protein
MGMSVIARLTQLFRPSAKSLAMPGADLFALFGLTETASGVMVSAEAAIKVPAVSSAVRLISEAAATLPRMVKAVAPDGTETDAPTHWANALLNGRANDWTSGFELIRDLMVAALTEDRGGIAWANRIGTGRVVELIQYRPGLITVDYDPNTGAPSYRLDNQPVDLDQMVHLRPIFGRAPLTLAREAIALALVMERHASKLFGNGARPSGVLSFPKGMGEESVKKARAAWTLTHENGETGKTAILYDGAEFKPLTINSTDAQFLENRAFQILEVARVFRVPPSMLFDLARATWSNTEQLGKEFLIYCLDPWLCALEGALDRVLFVGAERGKFRIKFDRDDMSRADLQTRATTINSLIASEVINPNEGRSWIGYAPYAGGEKFGNRNINPDQGGRPTREQGGKPDAGAK